MAETTIEWASHVWNPVTGCDRVSPGCANCYALTYAGRLKAMGQPKYQRDGGRASGPGFGLTMHEEALEEPARWRKPRRVFVNSMSDLFHDGVSIGFIARVFEAMAAAHRHDFLVLTKRPERMLYALTWLGESDRAPAFARWPLPNVWLGVSIENRRFVGRADLLRETPAAVRFISGEPLLGPLLMDERYMSRDDGWPEPVWSDGYRGPELELDGIDWVITGGESGHGHRRFDEQWARDIRDRCVEEGVAYFHKQHGGVTPKAGGRELDGRTWDEIPVAAAAGGRPSPDSDSVSGAALEVPDA